MTPNMPYPFYTIGHSNRSIAEFVALLGVEEVALVDIRTVRRSRANPQFNSEVLPEGLAAFGIGYECIPELGGLRGKAHDIPPTLNAFWINRVFTTTLTTRCRPSSIAAWSGLFPSGGSGGVLLCARKRSGGAVTAGSSPTI
ncbi:hypothetical protein MPLDJ20_260175 [Mesorhizobium plurifarium]|uniref:DUF488 domain-containing protein n=1 Tax=Mesorhizobium plurifarium TaxID=69974 RepID=A0A090FED7_MESPL|nr:hypothetical protein MPLDJ20_260175 [Mesorhizobium plurifarium]